MLQNVCLLYSRIFAFNNGMIIICIDINNPVLNVSHRKLLKPCYLPVTQRGSGENINWQGVVERSWSKDMLP